MDFKMINEIEDLPDDSSEKRFANIKKKEYLIKQLEKKRIAKMRGSYHFFKIWCLSWRVSQTNIHIILYLVLTQSDSDLHYLRLESFKSEQKLHYSRLIDA